MLRIPASVRVFVATRPISCSVGVDTLVARVREFEMDPLEGDLFCFFNPSHDCVKLLTGDKNGFWVFSKRLELGRFERLDPRKPWLEISREDLVMLLAGIDTKSAQFHRNFVRRVHIESRADDERSRAP
jgi:transposase